MYDPPKRREREAADEYDRIVVHRLQETASASNLEERLCSEHPQAQSQAAHRVSKKSRS